MSAPPSKKRKGLFDLVYPPAPSGAISASRSAAILDDEYRAIIQIEAVEESDLAATFFPDDSSSAEGADVVIGANVMKELQKPGIKEERLRNAIFTDLQERHNVEFPQSARGHRRSEIITRRTFKWDLRYKEKSLADVLKEFYPTLQNKDAAEEDVMPERILRGLLVTTTSLPDMTVIRGENLYFGEFKNKENYRTENAAKQCAVYLFALLYFYRVRLGRPVKAVFGFFVCGCGCFIPDPEYIVGLVRLSVPTELGQSMKCQVFQQTYITTNLTGMQLLVRFLRSGKMMEEGELQKKVNTSDRIPALLTLPEGLWHSPCLVKNGTTSMVFKGQKQEMIQLLQGIDSLYSSDKDALLDFVHGARPAKEFYLKIRLTETTLRSYPADPISGLWDAHSAQLSRLYCLKPKGNSRLGVFLMNDCGTVLQQAKESFLALTVEQLFTVFRALWQETMSLTDYLFHGDALQHNLVYDAGRKTLTLIDLDEGVQGAGTKVPKRVVEKSDLLPIPYLRYPNYLRSWRNRRIYTQLQLGASFFLMIQHFKLGSERTDLLNKLKREVTEANNYLKTRDEKEPDAARPENVVSVTNFITTVKEFIGQPTVSLQNQET